MRAYRCRMSPKIARFLIKYEEGGGLLGIKYTKIAEYNTPSGYSSLSLATPLLVNNTSWILWIEGVFMIYLLNDSDNSFNLGDREKIQ